MSDRLLTRRGLLAGGAALATGSAFAGPAWASADYPARPIKFVVGFPAGGAADSVARLVGPDMSKVLGQQLVIENRTGASGNIATQSVVDAPADGYTVYLAQIILATNPYTMGVKYDPRKDLTMVSQLVSTPVVMVTLASSGLKTVKDVVAAAQARNGELRFGGVLGTSSQFGPELLSRDRGFKFKFVPYRGGALAVQALLSGEVDVVFDLISGSLKGLIDAGQLNGVALMQETPVKGLESIPSAMAQGVSSGASFRSWMGLCVRAGTPAPIVDTLHKAAAVALGQPDLRARIEGLGLEVVPSASPAQFQAYYLAEVDRFEALIKSLSN